MVHGLHEINICYNFTVQLVFKIEKKCTNNGNITVNHFDLTGYTYLFHAILPLTIEKFNILD